MSLPQNEWREAGLAEPDELEPANPLLAEQDDEGGEEYHPGTARPDLEDKASEADVVEQGYEVDEDEGDDPAES